MQKEDKAFIIVGLLIYEFSQWNNRIDFDALNGLTMIHTLSPFVSD
jgi:hypothetical protein